MPDANRFAPNASPDAIAEAMRRDGYAVIESLAPDLTDRAVSELDAQIQTAPLGHTDFLGSKTRRLSALLGKSEAVQRLVIHDLVMDVCDRLLLPQCARYQLNFSGIMHLGPGERAQVLHRDSVLYPFRNPHPPTMVSTMWAGTDFTEENGGTSVVPGSHLWDDERMPRAHEIMATAMPKGSILLYASGVIHGAGANRSTGVRTGISVQYSLGWLRQEENQHLTYPPEIARSFPDRLQRLVGYEYGGPYLGFVNGDDPHRLVEEGPYDGPPMRSRPEIDAAQERIERLRFGDMEPVPAPAGEEGAAAVPIAGGATENATRLRN